MSVRKIDVEREGEKGEGKGKHVPLWRVRPDEHAPRILHALEEFLRIVDVQD